MDRRDPEDYELVIRHNAFTKVETESFGAGVVCVYAENKSVNGSKLGIADAWGRQRGPLRIAPAGTALLWAPTGEKPFSLLLMAIDGECVYSLVALLRRGADSGGVTRSRGHARRAGR